MIEYSWKISVCLISLGLTASIYSTWNILALKPYMLNVRQALWSVGGVIFLYSSIILWGIFVMLKGKGSEQTDTYLIFAGQTAAVISVICACFIRNVTCRSWSRASAILVTLGWIPLLMFWLFFKV
jgi:hypothetical protein